MKTTTELSKQGEGYIFCSYGREKYLKDALVSIQTLRRYDTERPVALCCSSEHAELLEKWKLGGSVDHIEVIPKEHQSIVGFKHNLHQYMLYDYNMYLDSDMIWCKDPDPLWFSLKPYGYTITGHDSADVFYGAAKSARISLDILLRRRQRTLKRFGLTHLYRVQTGIMYAADQELTAEVDRLASEYLSRKDETHFVNRSNEAGRKLESCEWSLGMAMTALKLYVYPWFNGYESIQLDYIHKMVNHDNDFWEVQVKYYCNPFIYGLRGLKTKTMRTLLYSLFSALPRSQDHMWVTPYILHFGWKHQKKYFDRFAEQMWKEMTAEPPKVEKE